MIATLIQNDKKHISISVRIDSSIFTNHSGELSLMANWSFEEVGDAASAGGRGRLLVQHKIPVDGRLLVQASHLKKY